MSFQDRPPGRSLSLFLSLCLASAAQIALKAPPPASATAPSREHPGPLGLKWGKSPADARSILVGKVDFVSEKPAAEEPYHTIDQHYTGSFAKLPTTDVFLRFYQGEFFYLAVMLNPVMGGTTPPTPVPIASIWQVVVDKMTAAYGKPDRLTAAPKLASDKAIIDPASVSIAQSGVLPLLWNERTKDNALATFQLRDLQIHDGFWDPFANWKFGNGVTIQAFVYKMPGPGKPAEVWQPVWLFVKDDLYRAWRQTVHTAQIIEPRDF